MAEHFYPQSRLDAPAIPGFQAGAIPQPGAFQQPRFAQPQSMPNYQPYQVPLPEKAPGLGSILAQSFGQGLGSGMGEGIQSSIKTAMNKKLIDRALGQLGPKATAKDIFVAASQLPPEAQQLFVKTYMPAREQEQLTERQDISSQPRLGAAQYKAQQDAQKSAALEEGRNARAQTASQDKKQNTFANLVNKDAGLTGGTRNDAIRIGGEYLSKGASPAQAFGIGKQIAEQRALDKSELESLNGPNAWFGKVSTDIKKVSDIKRNKSLDNDEIAIALLKKGYSPKEIQEEFKIKVSKELTNASPEEQQEIMQGASQPIQQESVQGKPLTPEYMQDVMARAGGDPNKAAAIAESEGYNVPKQ